MHQKKGICMPENNKQSITGNELAKAVFGKGGLLEAQASQYDDTHQTNLLETTKEACHIAEARSLTATEIKNYIEFFQMIGSFLSTSKKLKTLYNAIINNLKSNKIKKAVSLIYRAIDNIKKHTQPKPRFSILPGAGA